MVNRLLTLDLDGIGWKSYFQVKRGTTRVSIKKEVAVGLALRKSAPTFAYLARDIASNRRIILFYPDGKEVDGEEEDREE